MSFWIFWSKEALRDNTWELFQEFLQEVLMGNDGYDEEQKQKLQNRLIELYAALHKEERENRKLSEQVQSLSEQVESLSEEVQELRRQLKALLGRSASQPYSVRKPDVGGKAVSQTPRSAAAPPHIQQTPVRSGVSQTESFPGHFKILFRESAGNYDRVLQNFEEEAKKLKRTAERILSDSVSGESAFLNLIDKCIRDFAALREKSADADASDMAEKSAKILKKTVCKVLTQRQLKPYIESYLQSCGVEKLGWRVGRKLTDKDYAYLEEPVFYDETPELRYDGVITKIEQDSYVIGYEEDGVPRRALIPGTYHIGKYRGPAAYQRP